MMLFSFIMLFITALESFTAYVLAVRCGLDELANLLDQFSAVVYPTSYVRGAGSPARQFAHRSSRCRAPGRALSPTVRRSSTARGWASAQARRAGSRRSRALPLPPSRMRAAGRRQLTAAAGVRNLAALSCAMCGGATSRRRSCDGAQQPPRPRSSHLTLGVTSVDNSDRSVTGVGTSV